MMCVFKYIFVLFGLSSVAFSSDVSTSFLDAKLCPDPFPNPPEKYLQVVYPTGAADLGNMLKIDAVVPETGPVKPNITWDADPDTYYTLFYIDPDYPEADVTNFPGQYLNWAVGNIKGNNITTGDRIANYSPSLPPPKSAPQSPHRNIFVVYEQQSKQEFKILFQEERTTFFIDKYAVKYELGDPKFGNFFIAMLVY